jgi:alkanesulfonate monooxygenase SsuD/methylene tetrahydromethanopterin reductase-like flavin-dependent oxidoreductase (luciferase family)
MKFGTFHLMEQPYERSEASVYDNHLEQITLADELGFDAVWLTEHHFSSKPYVPDVMGEYCVSASPFAMACAVARSTKRVRIGSAIKILPLEHPLRTAEDAAMADIISKGRINFGVGLGYRKYEFDGLDIPIEEKAARFQEALKIILGAWTTEEFSYQGQFWKVPRLTLVPRPVQQPHPPVWIATRLGTREQINFAIENGYRLMCAWAPLKDLRTTYELMKQIQQERGQAGKDLDFTCLRHVFVAESDEEAEKQGRKYVEYYMKSTAQFRPIGDHERGEMIFGGPKTVIEKLRRLNETTGVSNLICWMNFGGMEQEAVFRSMKLFAREVMPAFRDTAEKPRLSAVS